MVLAFTQPDKETKQNLSIYCYQNSRSPISNVGINTRMAGTVILTVFEFQGGIFFFTKVALVQNFLSFPN